eukprot:gnl/TRDRNA2_/TRDRNA2_156647_c0_seq2.p1 gnl/TRDRNA2_/TRDRNA2_156647_c0~~gnl/TRDRNA2_/TRDRNA2_156647_c0_seq2.p1  ORF type:complete len:163 (-),score=26.47 gnl/TRDRNA2_/TRDRNA2_156647_c0_seq2:386-874(-)
MSHVSFNARKSFEAVLLCFLICAGNCHASPLANAARAGDVTLLRRLLDERARVDDHDHTGGHTALHDASLEGHVGAIEALVGRRASALAVDRHGQGPLHWAALGGHTSGVKMLLENGALANKADDEGRVALHSAATGGHVVLVQHLLSRRANVSAMDAEALV